MKPEQHIFETEKWREAISFSKKERIKSTQKQVCSRIERRRLQK